MASFRYTAIRTMFEVLSITHLAGLLRRGSKCRGVIFTLHRVLPADPADFSPNAILQVKPDFLDYAIRRVRQLGLDIVDFSEGVRRIESDAPEKPFVIFTFDDAYRDNLKFALPILRRHKCPFTLYVPTAFVDGVGEVWWQALEDIIAEQAAIQVSHAGETDYIATGTLAEKLAAFEHVYGRMRTMPERERVDLLRTLAGQYGFDLDAHCRSLIMDWSELRTFADEPLCTLGAHTVHHYELKKLPAAEARNEIEQSARVLKAQFGKSPEHLSFPIGGQASAGEREYEMARELGFRTAVTTRPGGIYAAHRDALHQLPRVSLNGSFQARRYVDVYATGAVFAMMPDS